MKHRKLYVIGNGFDKSRTTSPPRSVDADANLTRGADFD